MPARTADPHALCAPVLFPVTNAAGNFIADDVYREAERYEDGLAKLVHCSQTTEAGDGIRLAWEDEQIAEWLNRQGDRREAGAAGGAAAPAASRGLLGDDLAK